MNPPEWARVVLDDLGLQDWDLRWGRRAHGREKWWHPARKGMQYPGLTLSIDPDKPNEPKRIVIRAYTPWLDIDPVYDQLYTLLHEAAHALTGRCHDRVGGMEPGIDYSDRDFLRCLVMIGGFYGFTLDFIAERESVYRRCDHDFDTPDPCRPDAAALMWRVT